MNVESPTKTLTIRSPLELHSPSRSNIDQDNNNGGLLSSPSSQCGAVSGGGKSEISKSIADYLLHGPIFVADAEKDLAMVQEIFDRDYSDRWSDGSSFKPDYSTKPTRRVLSSERSLGSVIKLLTPSQDYTDGYNAWLESIPGYIYAIVFIIKRMHRGDAESDWTKLFTVDIVK